MTTTDEKSDAKKREIGEHVVFSGSFEPTKTKDLGEGIIEAVVTTGALDHHNENISMSGVDTSDYHGTVLYGHDYEGLPIGKTLSMTKLATKIKAKFQLAVQEYPFANLVYNMIKGGYLTDVSIGGIVTRWSEDYQTIEGMTMKEFSVVPIGANPEAMITAFKALGIDENEAKKEYRAFSKSVLLDKLEGIGDDELRDAIKVLKNLIDRLEQTANDPKLIGETSTKTVKHYIIRDARAVQAQSQRVLKTLKITTRG